MKNTVFNSIVGVKKERLPGPRLLILLLVYNNNNDLYMHFSVMRLMYIQLFGTKHTCDARHEKTDLKVFVVVIPKEGLAGLFSREAVSCIGVQL